MFAYLDENSALEDGEWVEGNPISYEDYQKILHRYTKKVIKKPISFFSSQEQQAQQMSELSKWRQAMEQKYAEIEEVSTNGIFYLFKSISIILRDNTTA